MDYAVWNYSVVGNNIATMNSSVVEKEVFVGHPRCNTTVSNNPIPPSVEDKLREEMGQLKEHFEFFMNVQLSTVASENYSWRPLVSTPFQTRSRFSQNIQMRQRISTGPKMMQLRYFLCNK